jgi:two-component system, OmpR family, response regulator VicR
MDMARSDNFDGKTIMVVDDDESVMSFLSFSLKGDGFNVVEAFDAEKALNQLNEMTQLPDLILLDIMLPKMDGFSMCKKLREETRYAKIPILFITAYAEMSNPEKVKQVGAQGLLEKPIIYSELLMQVMETIAGNFSLPTRLKYSL